MEWGERLPKISPRKLWSGFALSLCLHGLLITAVIWKVSPLGDHPSEQKQASQKQTEQNSADQFQAVGIVIRSPEENRKSEQLDSEKTTPAEQIKQTNWTVSRPEKHFPKPNHLQTNHLQAHQTSPVKNPLRKGETSFFEIRERGRRIVYLLDGSESMEPLLLKIAKQELRNSLGNLTIQQHFQVIFYDQQPHPILLNHRQRPDVLAPASERNVQIVTQKLDGIRGKGSTNHLAALQEAISRNRAPDVIFFLTDADTQLGQADLQAVQRWNKFGTRIHCIQLGTHRSSTGGQQTNGNIFLKRLAQMTHGKYLYRSVRNSQ